MRPLLTPADIAALSAQAELLLQVPAREIHDLHAGDWASRWLGRGLDFEESRQYSAGDDIRDMDWRTTARTGRPHLKIYREERQPAVHLVIDRGATMRFGTRVRLKAAQAARVAGLLAFAAVGRHGVVGASLWGPEDETLPTRHGRAAALALIEHAGAACPPLSTPPPSDAVRMQDRLAILGEILPRGARLAIISDFVWLSAAHEAALARLGARFDVWAIQVVDAVERALPAVGVARFHDLRRGQAVWLDTSDPTVRANCDTALRQMLAAQAARLTAAGLRHVCVDNAADDLAVRLAHG